MDKPATLAKYEQRLRETFTAEDMKAELEGKFLSTFESWNNVMQDYPNNHHLCNAAVVLLRVCRERGINVLGVTSERRERGRYAIQLPQPYKRGVTPVVYVGKYNYFTQNKSSKWRMLPSDRVFLTSTANNN